VKGRKRDFETNEFSTEGAEYEEDAATVFRLSKRE